MNMASATIPQLQTICLHEKCSLDLKYEEAARELQLRTWKDSYLTDLVRLWGKGVEMWRIAEELGVEEQTVSRMVKKYRLRGRKVV